MLVILHGSLLIVSLVKSVIASNCLVTGYCGVGQCCSGFGTCGTGAQYCGGGGYSYGEWLSSPYIANDCRLKGCQGGLCCSPRGYCERSTQYCGGVAPTVIIAPAPVQYLCQLTGCPVGSCCSQQGQCGTGANYCAAVSYSNCATTSCGVGLCCTQHGYCDRVGPYCAYKKSSSQSQSILLDGEFKGQATYYNETMVGTKYSTCGIERGQTLDENNQKIYNAALNQAQFDPYTVRGIPSSNIICQRKALVKGPEGEVVVRFIDRCPDCKENDIALGKEAFLAVAGKIGIGQISVEWHFMPNTAI